METDYIKVLLKLKEALDSLKSEIQEEFSVVKRDIELNMHKHLLASLEIINKLTIAADLRDEATGAHIQRISLYSRLIATEMNLNPEFIATVAHASPLHDIGKIGIKDAILLKEGKLTKEEMKNVQTHTLLGYEILKDSEYPTIQMAATIALCHHERFDGSGYPNKLKGTDIPLEGRIVMLADQYDSLRSERPYKKSMSHEEAHHILLHGDDITKPEYIDPTLLSLYRKIHTKFKKIYDTNK